MATQLGEDSSSSRGHPGPGPPEAPLSRAHRTIRRQIRRSAGTGIRFRTAMQKRNVHEVAARPGVLVQWSRVMGTAAPAAIPGRHLSFHNSDSTDGESNGHAIERSGKAPGFPGTAHFGHACGWPAGEHQSGTAHQLEHAGARARAAPAPWPGARTHAPRL